MTAVETYSCPKLLCVLENLVYRVPLKSELVVAQVPCSRVPLSLKIDLREERRSPSVEATARGLSSPLREEKVLLLSKGASCVFSYTTDDMR